MEWNTRDELVGRKVLIWPGCDEEEKAEVLGVSESTDSIMVKTDSGKVLVGNQYEEILG